MGEEDWGAGSEKDAVIPVSLNHTFTHSHTRAHVHQKRKSSDQVIESCTPNGLSPRIIYEVRVTKVTEVESEARERMFSSGYAAWHHNRGNNNALCTARPRHVGTPEPRFR